MRFPKLIEKRICAVKAAAPLTQDGAVITAYKLQAQVLVEQLRVTLQAFVGFDQEIADHHPKAPRLCDCFVHCRAPDPPGATLAGRLRRAA